MTNNESGAASEEGDGRAPKEDRYGLANLSLQFNAIGNTLGALAIQFDGPGGAAYAQQLLAAEQTLAGTQECIAETRHYLRNCATEALLLAPDGT